MAGTLGDVSACTIRGLIWALGRENLIIERPEAFKIKGKKYFLELKLMSAYEQLEKILYFIESFEKSNQDYSCYDNNVPWKNGIYASVFVNGILEVMRSFSCDLMEVEKNLLLDPTGICVESLATAQLMHDTYLAINNIIQQMCDGKLGGCQILDICQKAALKSQITTVEKIHILVQCLHKQMLKQIKSWCLYGELNDPYNEFFIRASMSPDQEESKRNSSLTRQPSFERSVSSEFYASLIESTSTLLPFNVADQDHISENIDNCYTIDSAYVPSHLPYSLICKIFSLGKFMIQIKHNPSNKTPVSFMTVNLSDYGIEKGSVRCLFNQLEDGAIFHHHMLENVIDVIWCQMNKYMKRVAEEEGELSIHHRNITDIFLMGRGELFRHFLEKASHLLLNDATKVHSRSLDLALERVAQYLYGTDDVDFLKRFQFCLPPKGDITPGQTVLSTLKLCYKSPWPLPLIYSQEVINTYCTVFIFLLSLKRAHLALTQAWNNATQILDVSLRRCVNELHFRFISLMTNLQSYIFIDVILSETDQFREILLASDSFDEIMKAHAKFLSNIIMRLFLPSNSDKLVLDNQNTVSVEFRNNVGSVHKEIMNLFSLIHKFNLTVRVFSLDSDGASVKLNSMSKEFDSVVVNIISQVKKINEKYCSEYLYALIMRLDYNDYYINKYDI